MYACFFALFFFLIWILCCGIVCMIASCFGPDVQTCFLAKQAELLMILVDLHERVSDHVMACLYLTSLLFKIARVKVKKDLLCSLFLIKSLSEIPL